MEEIQMKKNPNDNYCITENEIILEDNDTGNQLIFFIDKENGLVIRSFMEDEINFIINQYDNITASEKRRKKRELNEELPKEKSQYNYFVVEKIEGENLKRKKLNTLYGLPRTAIGLGERYWSGNGLTNFGERIELHIYDKYQQYTIPSQISLIKLTQKLGLKGRAYIEK